MPSLFELLLKTMPFAAVEQYAIANGKSISELTVAEVKKFVTLLPECSGFYVELPALDSTIDRDLQPLWAFSYNTSRPAEVGSIYCRVHDADYVGHHVADRVAWGVESQGYPHKPEILVKFQAGGEAILPLTSDYLLWAFRVNGGSLPEDATALWRLRSNLDTSIVAVFLFDIDPNTGVVTKSDFDRVPDPQLRDELRDMSRAVKELGSVPDATADPPHGDDAPPARLSSVEGDIWGARALRAPDFWPAEPERGTGVAVRPAGMDGVVGESIDVQTEPARVMVVFSFATCCERADFEPGGLVGFARCYPHLLVSTTVPIELISASAHVDRPKTMSKWHEEDRDMSASCCKPPYDGWTEVIGSLLVTDANESTNWPFPFPYWSNMFNYFLVDPYLKKATERYHVIRTDRPNGRESVTPLVRREVVLYESGEADYDPEAREEDGIVRKVPRQGMFDNVHLAPRLRLMNVPQVGDNTVKRIIYHRYPIEDRSAWHLDDIVMAPFCAHDCLHLHWRWGKDSSAKWTLGWDTTGPYRQAGAPMVPVSQDVWLWFRGRVSLTYHVEARRPRPTDGWHVLMHHGFGYAVSIQGAALSSVAMAMVDNTSRVHFWSSSGELVTATRSTAAYYWKARYIYTVVDGTPVVRERLSFPSEDQLTEAMDL